MSAVKKSVVVLGAIFIVEAIVVAVFLTSFENLRSIKTPNIQYVEKKRNKLIFPESLTLAADQKSIKASKNEILSWTKNNEMLLEFDPNSLSNYYQKQTRTPSTNSENADTLVSPALNYRTLGQYLSQLATNINNDPVNAELTIENDRAKIFIPHGVGQRVNLFETQRRIAQALVSNAERIDLSIEKTRPELTLGDLNSQGINELLVTGQSDFSGSSASRIQNIKVGSSQYNGRIINPGEEFSFNKYLGPIDAAHGYKPELVIKPEGATPEFGGGLCQVSTTAFRAAFFAGLPITERRNHSYAVRYYEWIADDKPRAVGLDATIYSGVQDMKFINDTPGSILIWTRIEGKKLFFDFYGTKDDREVVVDGPHPYDRRESGAVKSKVTRIVTKPNEAPAEVTFQSNYVPPKTLPAVVEYPKPPEETASPLLVNPPSTN